VGRLAQKLHSTGASRSSGAIPTWFRLRPYRFDGCRIGSRRASRANWARLFRRRGAGYWPGPIAGVVSGARRHHPALHPTPRRPCLLEPAAGRSDPTGPATRRAHRDAADRTRSAARLGRAAQTAHKLNMRTAQPCSGRSLQPGLSAVADDPAFPKVGLPQCPSEKKGRTAPARARHVPSLVPVHAQSAAKPRASPPTAMEFTAQTNSALEGDGFGLPIPGREAVKPSCETVSKTGADLLGNRRFESISLQQRVCKPPVPLGRGAEPEMPSPLTARNTLIFLVSRACARETKKTQSEGSRLLAVPRARPRRLPLDLRVWNGPSCPETDRCFRSIYPKAQARESCALTFARAETSFSSVDLRPDCGGPQGARSTS
jgi:hypothetical protein